MSPRDNILPFDIMIGEGVAKLSLTFLLFSAQVMNPPSEKIPSKINSIPIDAIAAKDLDIFCFLLT
jgi:hypothetical protein